MIYNYVIIQLKKIELNNNNNTMSDSNTTFDKLQKNIHIDNDKEEIINDIDKDTYQIYKGKLNEIIEKDLPVAYKDDSHITIGKTLHRCRGPRTHVSHTGEIKGFRLLHSFVYDAFNNKYLLVGFVGEDSDKRIAALEKKLEKCIIQKFSFEFKQILTVQDIDVIFQSNSIIKYFGQNREDIDELEMGTGGKGKPIVNVQSADVYYKKALIFLNSTYLLLYQESTEDTFIKLNEIPIASVVKVSPKNQVGNIMTIFFTLNNYRLQRTIDFLSDIDSNDFKNKLLKLKYRKLFAEEETQKTE